MKKLSAIFLLLVLPLVAQDGFPARPSAPWNLYAFSYADGILLTWAWQGVDGTATFNVYRSDSVNIPGTMQPYKTGIKLAEGFTDNFCTPGHRYWYVMTTVSHGFESNASNTADAAVPVGKAKP